MFTALKKLVTNEQTGKHAFPEGIRAMGQNLQRKFARGVHYNMKIIIKGDRNTGKTCLFHRLQGAKFSEEYLPTHEIQVTSIQWSYKATDDIVKVEVWDVVDKGKRQKKHLDSLKLTSTDEDGADSCLDAEFIDVYKNTHGVIMLMDITKHWTYDYIAKEIDKVPSTIPVLILANFRDMGEHRTVLVDSVADLVHATNRPPCGAQVRFAESSMRNGYGLKYVYKFFNLPFLQLQKETLERQLATNKEEVKSTITELNALSESEDQNYELFLEGLEVKRKSHVAEQKAIAEQTVAEQQAAVAAKAAAAITKNSANKQHVKQASPTQNTVQKNSPAAVIAVENKPSVSAGGSEQPAKKKQFEKQADVPAQPKPTLTKRISKLFTGGVDETTRVSPPPMPEGGLGDDLDSFLGDTKQSNRPQSRPTLKYEPNSDSDDDMGHNPMVADFADDVSSGDEALFSKRTTHVAAISSSSEDERPIRKERPTPVSNQINKVNSDLLDSEPDEDDVIIDQPIITSPKDDISDLESDNDFKIKPQRVDLTIDTPDQNESDEDESETKDGPTIPSPLEYEDLSVLESFGVNNKYAIRSSSVTSSDILKDVSTPELSDTDSSSVVKKHRKHRDKDKTSDDKSSRRKHKHKKHKDKERDRDEERRSSSSRKTHSTPESKESKKSSKKSSSKESRARPVAEPSTTQHGSEMNALEEFLGGGGEDYESI